MNMTQAEEQGLFFTGAIAEEWMPDEVADLKKQYKAIKKLGYRAVIIKSPKNDWEDSCYRIYAENEYFEYIRARERGILIGGRGKL